MTDEVPKRTQVRRVLQARAPVEPLIVETETPQIEGLRRCPSPSGYALPLIIQAIRPELCLQRQREFYHKCHRCLYRGKPADFVANE